MDELQEVDAKILYSSLKHLTDDERQFLADKYRVEKRPRKPQMSDKEMAEQYGISPDQYAHKRWKIEIKLKPFIYKYQEKFKEEKTKAIDKVHGVKTTEKQKRELDEFMKMIEEDARKKYEASLQTIK